MVAEKAYSKKPKKLEFDSRNVESSKEIDDRRIRSNVCHKVKSEFSGCSNWHLPTQNPWFRFNIYSTGLESSLNEWRDDCSGILSGKCLTHFLITVWFIVKSFQDYEVKVRTEGSKTGLGLRHSTLDLKKSTFAVFKVINQNHPRLSNRSNGTAMGTPKPGWSNRNFDTYHPWPINRNRVTLDSSD